MSIFAVIRKSDSAEVYRYSNDTPVEWEGMPFADFDHVLLPPEDVVPVVTPLGPRRLTKLQFIDRLGDAAYVAILTMAKTSGLVEAFIRRFEMTTPEADYTSIDLDDPRTVAGVTQIGAALEAASVVDSGWTDEVLNG
jgi:hypothetical protein